MILVRAPLRISFVGGGTDLPDFYRMHTGRVISATIDKFVYVLVNPTPLIDKFTVKYQKTETASHPNELEHTRVKLALIHLNLTKGGLEIASFADLPAKTGLGSSSAFSVALMKGLNSFLGKKLDKTAAAEAACMLEIELLKEPIGKQDQYAASFGGINVFEFHADESVGVDPVFVDYQTQSRLESHLLLFFTGITRAASLILGEQRLHIDKKVETYKKMAGSVHDFKNMLMEGDMEGMAKMLHEGWLRKKSLEPTITNSAIEDLYEQGLAAGAWGGKILGAGGGGCLLFLADPARHEEIGQAMRKKAGALRLAEFRKIPVKFVKSGTDILFSDRHVVLTG